MKLLLYKKKRHARPIKLRLWHPVEKNCKDHRHGSKFGWLWRSKNLAGTPVRHGAPLLSHPARLPFIVYIPDCSNRCYDNTLLLAKLASHCFVIAEIEDTNYDLWTGFGTKEDDRKTGIGDDADSVGKKYSNLAARNVHRTVEVASALLDALNGLRGNWPLGDWAGLVDLERTGILGYSFGGAVAAEATLVDRRFVAAVNLDGPAYGAAAALGVHRPYLLMLSDTPQPKITYPGTTRPNRRFVWHQPQQPQSHIIRVAGTKHEDFSGRLTSPYFQSFWQRRTRTCTRTQSIIAGYAASFFKTYVAGEQHPLMCVRHSPYHEVRFINPQTVQPYGAY